jgi:hypothetical protein
VVKALLHGLKNSVCAHSVVVHMTAIQRHATTLRQWFPTYNGVMVVRSSCRQEEEEHQQKPSGKTSTHQQQDSRLRHGFLIALGATVIVLIGVHSSWWVYSPGSIIIVPALLVVER